MIAGNTPKLVGQEERQEDHHDSGKYRTWQGKKKDKKIIMIAGNTGPGRARRKTRRSS